MHTKRTPKKPKRRSEHMEVYDAKELGADLIEKQNEANRYKKAWNAEQVMAAQYKSGWESAARGRVVFASLFWSMFAAWIITLMFLLGGN